MSAKPPERGSMTAAEWRLSQGLAPPGADRIPAPRWPGETAFHLDVIRWWRALEILDGTLLIHVPNGGNRRPLEAAILKGMGVEPGVADLGLLLPRGRMAWIELKHGEGKLSAAQRVFRTRCLKLEHSFAVARDFHEVERELQELGVEYVEGVEAWRIRMGR